MTFDPVHDSEDTYLFQCPHAFFTDPRKHQGHYLKVRAQLTQSDTGGVCYLGNKAK